MRWTTKLKVFLSLRRRIRETRGTAAPITLKGFVIQYVLGFNKTAYWPVHHSSVVSGVAHIETGIGTAPGLSHGCYIFSGEGSQVTIGNYAVIAPNVCIAGFNHDIYNHSIFTRGSHTHIGDYCWIGMNACVLPGVILGNHTVIAAGAVVTHSFPDGYVILAGNPATVIRQLKKEECINYNYVHEYVGYLTAEEFRKSKKELLKINL